MNSTMYAENPNAALKIAYKEDYESVQRLLVFYRDTYGLKKYYEDEDSAKIIQMGRSRWQDIMNSVNSKALYYGKFQYENILKYVNTIKKLVIKDEKQMYTTIEDWHDKYPDLLSAYQSLEESSPEEDRSQLFLDYFNELRIAANKEFLKLMF